MLGANLIGSMVSLVRNILIARLLMPEDFGIGALFVLVLTFLEMLSNLSVDRQIVQDERGGGRRFISNVHFFELFKGLFLGMGLYLLAPLLSNIFKLGEAQWAFEVLSVVPVIRGFRNWSSVTEQRESVFLKTSIMELLPQLLSFILFFVISEFVKDFTLYLYLILFQVIFQVVLSHILKLYRYSICFDLDILKSIFVFGWPLMVNGFLLYFFMQGDRALLSVFYDMTLLGLFSAAFSISIMPTVILGKFLNSLFLPLLSRGGQVFYYRELLVRICIFMAFIYVLFICVGGEFLYRAVFGEKYHSGAVFLVVLGVVHSFRIIRIAPAVIATSVANTKSILYSNVVRGIGFLVAIIFASVGVSPVYMAASAGLGELLAISYQYYFVSYRGSKINIGRFDYCLFAFLVLVVVLGYTGFVPKAYDFLAMFYMAILVLVLSLLGFLYLFFDYKKRVCCV